MIEASQQIWEADYDLAFSLSEAFFEARKRHFLGEGTPSNLSLDMLMAQYKEAIDLANTVKRKCRSKLDEVR